VWAHSLRAEEYTKKKLKELNGMTDDEVLMALKILEKPPIIRKMVSQTSFGHISVNSSTIPTVSKPA